MVCKLIVFFFFSETQVILPLLKSDLYATMMECVNGDLSLSLPAWHTDRYAVGVVAASGGYPGPIKKGCVIHGLKDLEVCDCDWFTSFKLVCSNFNNPSKNLCLVLISLTLKIARGTRETIINNYSLGWRWIGVEICRKMMGSVNSSRTPKIS